jgi:hypothetical protein
VAVSGGRARVCVRAWMMRCIRLLYTGLGFWTVLYAVCYACHVQAMCWQGPRWWCNVHYYSIYTRQRDQSCLGQNAQRRPCSQHKHSPIPLSLSLSHATSITMRPTILTSTPGFRFCVSPDKTRPAGACNHSSGTASVVPFAFWM